MGALSPVRLVGHPVSLRPLAAGDVDAVYDLFRRPEVARFWSRPAFAERSAAAQVVDEWLASHEAGSALQWAVVHDGALIGTVGLFAWSPEHRRAELGFALHPDHWGHGRMRRALELVLGYAWGSLGLHRIEADTDPRNDGARRLLERLGFQHEGTLRQRWLVAGEACDSALYGLLAPSAKDEA